MKKFIYLFFLLFLPATIMAQETVYSITVEEREDEFYAEQIQAWRKVVDREPQNAVAWQNLYHAYRYHEFPKMFHDAEYRKEVDAVVEEMRKAIPDSYEAHYIYAWQNGFGKENFHHLMKAYEIDSTRPKIMEDLFTHYYRQGEWAEAKKYMVKWYNSKHLAPQLLHFGYNLLACTEENAVLFLFGDNDSYPVWMLQTAKGVRTDVAALNVQLMLDEKFARRAFQLYGLKVDELAYKLLDVKDENRWSNVAKFIRHLDEKNPDRKIYMPISMLPEVRKEIKDDLQIVGTLFEYCPQRFDNIAVLKRNWSQNLALDYLDFDVYSDDYRYTPAGLPYTMTIYVYPAMTLYWHYKSAGESQKAADMLAFCEKIAVMVEDPGLVERFKGAGSIYQEK